MAYPRDGGVPRSTRLAPGAPRRRGRRTRRAPSRGHEAGHRSACHRGRHHHPLPAARNGSRTSSSGATPGFGDILEGNRTGPRLLLGCQNPNLEPSRNRDWPRGRAELARPPASVITTSVRSPLTNAPPGPSSGRWKLTAAPATGLPVSSVISTAIGRLLRDPGRCTAPSPSITRICRMATWPSAAAAQRSHKAASRTDWRNKTPLRRTSACKVAGIIRFF